MTFKEIKMVIELYAKGKKRDIKAKQRELYDLAYMTSIFVGKVFNGHRLPKIEEIYPEEQESVPEEKTDNSWVILKERMIDFANEANKRRNK